MKPQPGDVRQIETTCLTAEDIYVVAYSRFWSWVFRKPHYWVTQWGSLFTWLESADAFIKCRYDRLLQAPPREDLQ